MKEKLILGIELGSTRIKSVLINEVGAVKAQGAYSWENALVDGLWSYGLDEAIFGLQESYRELVKNYGNPINELDAIGISGMMHGYLAFDENDELLAPFRTWRNTNAAQAASELTELFSFNVPMRWSVSQYYQSVLDGLDHVSRIAHLTTLAGYVHYMLTGKRCLGLNDASGMFPISDGDYCAQMLAKFDALLEKHGTRVEFKKLLPKPLFAGAAAGVLTKSGALLLDPTGTLKCGCPLCPPEGDMGTGMICTNTVKPKSANASLGTSANLTVILDRELRGFYPEIDVIMTPDGHSAALVHANTCTSVIDSWIGIFSELLSLAGAKVDKGRLYELLFEKSLSADSDVGGVCAYNFLAAEPLCGIKEGIPSVILKEGGVLDLANFMQAQIFGAIATLSLGLDILRTEGIEVDAVFGHGGYFKTPKIGQAALSALIGAPVTVTPIASEGGAFGIALLALYMLREKISLSDFLDGVFASTEKHTYVADEALKSKFEAFMKNYKRGLLGLRTICNKQ